MPLSKLPIKATKRSRATDPKEIFKSLTLRGTVQNIWEPQAQALKRWHDKRIKNDVVIGMNTGAGKTLVGFLIGQSLVNETRGKVLYVCPTNQLVEQAARRAGECGIEVATYMGGGRWTHQNTYDTASGVCITNYAAVFNGRSIFRGHDVRGIIFDDAHVAGNFVRSNFTLRIPNGEPVFQELANLFRGYFAKSSQTQKFEDALSGDWLSLLFVPMFEVWRKADSVRHILVQNKVEASDATKFPWQYLKDQLSRCVILISGSGIEITPPLLPVHTLPYFSGNVRRIYLTATLPSQVELLRTFGIADFERIIPGGKSGEAQRQFLILAGHTDGEHKALALQLVQKRKACIIAPSNKAADAWCPPAMKFERTAGNNMIERFAKSKKTEKIAFAARYDGIDLPGDACRILILDGLPVGAMLIDRFIDQSLRIERLRSAHTATRVIQAIGRIFRGNTDHGAVLICGGDLQRWLRDPQNLQYMPILLQQQIKLGIELSRMVDEKQTTFEELLIAVLNGDREWDKLYSEHIESFETHEQHPEPQWFTEVVAGESQAFRKLWDGNFPAAATDYASLADDAEKNDRRLAAWYRHWEGLAHDLARDDTSATRAYVLAANERAELGRPVTRGGVAVSAGEVRPGSQAVNIGNLIVKKKTKTARMIKQIAQNLTYGPDTNPTEQALCDLGGLLGLEPSRPEREERTGPDVLWRHVVSKSGVALEAKTNKQASSQYQKKGDIGQFYDHIAWLEKKFKGERFIKAIVGPKLRVSRDANPPEDLRIITLDQFIELTARVQKLYAYVESTAHATDLEVCVERGLRDLGLTWPNCIESLESSLAIDLQTEEAQSEELE